MDEALTSTVVNVLLVESRKLLREGLCALLGQHADIRIVGEVEDAGSVSKLIRPLAVDVVVLNVIPPQVGGVDVVQRLTKQHPRVRVVALTMDASPRLVRDLMNVGTHGCLTKQSSALELVDAIRTVMTGKTYLSPSLADALLIADPASLESPAPMRPLAPREREILQLIAAGESTKTIARMLGVGTKTVETHRRRMMQKLNKHSVAELTKYAVREGLATLESV